MNQTFAIGICLVAASMLNSCSNNQSSQTTDSTVTDTPIGTFGHDLTFLKTHQDVLLLKAPDNDLAQVAVIGAYQGRVMTSTANGTPGNSYGWINYKLIASNKFEPHMNAYGGEDRIWLSPEGGQFSVYFPKGAAFDFDKWQTPAIVDTAVYSLVNSTPSQATFTKSAILENHSGTRFDIQIERKISVLSQATISQLLGITDLASLKAVGYETENSITNTGANWQKDKGTIGVWILGMFNPSEQTSIIAPFTKTRSKQLLLTDDYFGKVPADRLKVLDSAVVMRADGKHRSKIGLAPLSAKPLAGSYDAQKGILTIVQFDVNPTGDYLKSSWELHKEPYKGDAMNAYNDGPLADGGQLGPFYELESSSSVSALKKGEKLTHHHRTVHIEGDKATLQQIAKRLFSVDLEADLKW